mmetsp:Transcript_10388/g.15727  ORF Transcript_10388/g.15727 Transcript_10388/m.15727 type:complete len:695 (+) Transcript_10388:40-2124(+)
MENLQKAPHLAYCTDNQPPPQKNEDGIYSHESVEHSKQPQHASSSSNHQTREILDNIIVGYAFGPKKMETMGLIMAEASKALSTFECGEGVLPTLIKKKKPNNHHHSSSQQQQQHQQQRYNNNSDPLELTEESSMTTSAASTLTNHYPPGGFDDEEDIRSLSSTPSQRSHSQNNGNSNNNMRGIQLTFMPDSSGFIHLVNTNSSSGGSSFGGGESVTDSFSAATTADGTNSTFFSRKQHFGTAERNDGGESDPPRNCAVVQRHPIRVSFVPIDLDKPLEEQHGGKFDVILHKMTEDILCLSKMLRPQFTNNSEGVEEFHQNWIHTGVKPLDLITPTDTMTRHQARASRRIQRLREYKKIDNPSCVLVDSPSNILAVMSRADMAEVLSCCLAGVTTKGGIPVRTPRFKVVDEDREVENSDGCDVLANEIDNAGFEYPLIAKPLTAAGTKSSHHMGIVLARDGLQRLKTPCLLQEYANHGEKLFKVYVLGNSVWVYSRDSMPNLPLGEKIRETTPISPQENNSFSAETNNRPPPNSLKRRRCESYVEFERQAGSRCYVEFNSQRPYPKISDFGNLHDAPRNKQHRVSPTNPPTPYPSSQDLHQQQEHDSTQMGPKNNLARFVTREEIEPVTNALRSAFGLDLFGFDVLVKEGRNGKEILVVDVNYFPGYKEVPNFPSLLAQYLTTKAVESRWRNFE